jgi:transposase
MDDAPSHSSLSTRSYFEENNINHLPSPAQSPDFNPIELVWNDMGHYISNHLKPSTANDLKLGILKFWNEIFTIEYCNSKIDHLERVFRKCLDIRGHGTGL